MTEILGTDSSELIIGTDADDIITGLSGYDTLDGGEGSDVYIVTVDDFHDRYVDFYQDTGTSGYDVIRAQTAGVDIGIGHGFTYASSGIEAIEGLGGSRIIGDNDAQDWDFTDITITGVDMIFGNGGMDVIHGSAAGDTIDGGEGFDELYGGLGDDTIFGGADSDLIFGELGDDTLHGDTGHDRLYGDEGNDTLYGGEGHDQLYGGEGDDILTGGAGYDYLDGGEGSDTYYVSLENGLFVDEINDTGTSGTDRVIVTGDNVVIGLMNGFGQDSGIEEISGEGFEGITVGGTNDAEVWDFTDTTLTNIGWVNALGGHDTVTGNADRNYIDGGDGHDVIYGEGGSDVLYGGEGHDILYGGEDRDYLYGGTGYNTLYGGEGSDVYAFYSAGNGGVATIIDDSSNTTDYAAAFDDNAVIGLATGFSINTGVEIITANGHSNITIGGTNDAEVWDFSRIDLYSIESINTGGGMDVVRGSTGDDTINAGSGHDFINGDKGDDIINGGEHSDFLFGGNGHDIINGDSGSDILTGGKGKDVLTGGEGYDIFAFDKKSNKDIITDFNVDEDLIDLREFGSKFDFDDITMKDSSDGVVLKFSGGSEVLLEGVDMDMVSIDMFIF